MNNEIFLIAAYGLIWAGLFGYLFLGRSQLQGLVQRVALLEELVAEKEGTGE